MQRRYNKLEYENASLSDKYEVMAPTGRTSRANKRGRAREQDAFQNQEQVVKVEHRQAGRGVSITALTTWGDRGLDRNEITKACAESVGISTEPKQILKLVWLIPGRPISFEDDFVVVDSASHDIVFSKEASDKISTALQEVAPLAVTVWMRKTAGSSHRRIRTRLSVRAEA
jgi:hypothetical protein